MPSPELPASAWARIKAQLDEERYAVRPPLAPRDPGVEGLAPTAANPAMGFRAAFEHQEVSIANARKTGPAWEMRLGLAAYGYAGDLKPVPPARVRSRGNRVSYIRGDVEEWYLNTPAGIEQGFTLAQPPGNGDGRELVFRVSIGGLTPRMAADGANIDLFDAGGARLLTYRKLKVIDAGGRVLPARMTAVAAGGGADAGIRIAVRDAGATYPLLVDPILAQPKLTAADGADYDYFGASVSVSGDTVVVGAYDDDDNGAESGSAYLFYRDQGGADSWGQVAKLTAADGAEGDYFGCSVSVSGDMVAVGAWWDDDNGAESGSVYLRDGEPGITVSPTSGLTTTEAGGSATFTVVLDTNPYADVSIDLTISDEAECALSTTSLTFTRADWNSARTVTVTGVDDDLDDGDQACRVDLSAAVSLGLYDGYDPDDVFLTNLDDDTVGVTVSPTSGLTTSEAGASASFSVVLNTPPTDAVTIALSCDDDAEATVSPATLTFTPSDWDTAQTVTVTGVDDDDDDGDRPVVITTAPCESGDPAYAGIDPANVSLTNLDDDEATGGGSDPDAGPGNDVGNDVGNGSDGGCFIDGLSTAYRTRAGALP